MKIRETCNVLYSRHCSLAIVKLPSRTLIFYSYLLVLPVFTAERHDFLLLSVELIEEGEIENEDELQD